VRAALALAAVVLPRLAEACPSCAGNDRYATTRLVLLGSFVLLPFAVAGLVARIIRRLDRRAAPPDDF
jgi:hypothetical protein